MRKDVTIRLTEADARLLARAGFAAFHVSADGGRTDLTGRESEALDQAFRRLEEPLSEALADPITRLEDAAEDGLGFIASGVGTSRSVRSGRGRRGLE
jgi:hypothetical protein